MYRKAGLIIGTHLVKTIGEHSYIAVPSPNLQPGVPQDSGIFQVGTRAFATCATMATDDELREEYVRILTKASMEITAAYILHLKKKEN